MTQPARPVTRLTTSTRTNLDGILKGDGSALGTVAVGANLSYDGTTLSAANQTTAPGGSSGQVQYNSGGAFAGAAFSAVATSGTLLTLTAGADSDVPLVLKGNSPTQSGEFLDCRSSDGTSRTKLYATGGIRVQNVADDGSQYWFRGYRASDGAALLSLFYSSGVIQCTLNGQELVVGSDGSGDISFGVPVGLTSINRRGDGFAGGLSMNFAGAGAKLFQFNTQWSGGPQYLIYADGTQGGGDVYPFTSYNPAAYTGPTYAAHLQSSAGTERAAWDASVLWATATDATRKARAVFNIYDTAAREALRLEASGTEAMLGFYGVAATARQLLATGAGHTVDDVIGALQTLGLVKQA